MGRVPGATSWPTAVVEILVPSQAAACDSMLRGKKEKPFWFSSLGQQVKFEVL